MHTRIRVLIVAAATLALTMSLAACGGGGGKKGQKTIVFSTYSREPAFIQAAVKGLQQEAAKKGWKLEATYAGNEPTVQVSQIENAITKKPDAIIVWANDKEAPIPAARKAKEAGIKVVTMGQDFGKDGQDVREFFVSQKYEEVGAEKAKKLVALLGGKGKIGIIRGIRGADFTEKQGAGAETVLKASPGIKVVAKQYAGAYASDAGLTTAENMLTAHPDLDGIYVDNDDLTVGVIKALQERKLAGKVKIVSTDGTPGGLDAVKKGLSNFDQALCGVMDGEIMIDSLDKFFNGTKPPGGFVQTKRFLVTPTNIKTLEGQLAKCS